MILNKYYLISAIFFMFLLASNSAKAQHADSDTTVLEEVVVVSSRFREKKALVAQQVQIVTADRIQQFNAPTTADVLQQTPGILVQKSQLGGGSPVIRGFEANRVLLVVDGVRLNNAIYRGGHLQNVITLDNNALERVEVAFGPSSVSYGSDALGGVVHFYTKKPKFNSTDLSAFTRYSTAANERTAGFSANFGKNKWASFSNVTYSDFGDLRQGAQNYQPGTGFWKRNFYVERLNEVDQVIRNNDENVQKQSGYQQLDILQKLLISNSSKVSQMINLQYSTSSNVPRYDRLAQLSSGNPTYAEWYYGPQNRLLAAYQLQLQSFSGIFNQANITAAYQNIQESRHDRRLNNPNLNNRSENLDIFSLNADFNKRWLKTELSYGLELSLNQVGSSAYRENLNTQTRSRLDTRYPDGGSDVISGAVFVSNRLNISDKISLNQGLRLTAVNLRSRFNDQTFFPFPFNTVKQNNTALSGNLGLVFRPDENWKFSALTSTGFRAPNVDDLSKVFESVPGKVVVPNPNLKPETTYNAELGIARGFSKRASISLAGFYTWYRNAITTQPFLFNGDAQIIYNGQQSDVTANVNAGKAFVTGLSAEVSTLLLTDLWLKSNVTYTYGRITSVNPVQPLDHIPPLFGISSLRYRAKRYEAEFFVQYNGDKKLSNYNVNGEDNIGQATPFGMPSWYTINVRTGFQVNRSLRLKASLENILDRNYRVFASGISAPGRNLIIALRGNF